ncbi:DUF2399 domain-containing protein [Acidovorax sp. GBBC 3334]|uniref:DUF2399 domain-containing protein n=1 Tax=Acidovorax sp. GBBC 3334 TaxID=2940496 RepID=UPI003FA46105
MSADDYVSATETVTTRVSLAGVVVSASWDDELSARMMALDARVAEEAFAARILIDLQHTTLPASL